MSDIILLCRFGEIFLKKDNRSFFERRLVENMKRATAPFGARIERTHGRILVEPRADAVDETVAATARVFGLTSLSAARRVPRTLEAISAAAVEETRAALPSLPTPCTFKVEARRSDKRFQPASPEIARLVGAAIVEGLGLPVDVHKPALTVGVEVGFEHAYVYARTVAAPGGLPVGVTGKVDLLLSGGIDSPVAGWMAMKRGCDVAATYFHSFPFTGDRTKEKVRGLVAILARWHGPMKFRVVPFTDAQKALRDAGDMRMAVVLYRRMMMRVACRLARLRGATALVTGEALAQVASQTIENLAAIEHASDLVVLRPVLGHDKVETIAIAHRIGTYEKSIEPYEDACSMFVPKHPELHAKLDKVLAIEAKVDIAALVEACVAGTETMTVTA